MNTETITTAMAENWPAVLAAFLVFLKAVINLVPTDKPVPLFGLIDALIDWLAPDRRKTNQNGPTS